MDDLAERIAKLKELEAKAAAGPWTVDQTKDEYGDPEWWVNYPDGTPYPGDCSVLTKDNAYLIANLRNNALPIIEALESENEKLRADLKCEHEAWERLAEP